MLIGHDAVGTYNISGGNLMVSGATLTIDYDGGSDGSSLNISGTGRVDVEAGVNLVVNAGGTLNVTGEGLLVWHDRTLTDPVYLALAGTVNANVAEVGSDLHFTASPGGPVALINGDFETTGGLIHGSLDIRTVNGFGWTVENTGTEIQNSSVLNGELGVTMSGDRWGRLVADAGNAGAMYQATGTMAPGYVYTLTGDVVGGAGNTDYNPVFELRRGGPTGTILASQAFALADGVTGAVNLEYEAVAADNGELLYVRVYAPTLPGSTASRGGIDELAIAGGPPPPPRGTMFKFR
jgi:hypothetical protein